MKKSIISIIRLFDQNFSQTYLKLFKEKKSLIIFLFHALFRNSEEINSNVVNPQQGITVQHFRQFIEYYLSQEYIFVSPEEILNGLAKDRKYVLITFDDGYFNNQYALPVLREYGVPAVFFITPNNVKDNKCFWWDVLYRERIRRGTSEENILREIKVLKLKTYTEIEMYLKDLFGEETFKPIGDIDRPFTPSELKVFSAEKNVFLGNHASDHMMLANCSLGVIKSQILNAQNTIYDITGITPTIISYPLGNYSNKVVKISKEIGLDLGITADPKKNYLPIDYQGNGHMLLGRFTLDGNEELIKQCEVFRSDMGLYNWARKLSKSRY